MFFLHPPPPPSPSLQTGEHLIQCVHSETQRMEKEYWEAVDEFISPPKPTEGEEATKTSSDTYCYELMSMIIGLCHSEPGCQFLAGSNCLVRDLFTLLHVASMRVQLQVRACVTTLQSQCVSVYVYCVIIIECLPEVQYNVFYLVSHNFYLWWSSSLFKSPSCPNRRW